MDEPVFLVELRDTRNGRVTTQEVRMTELQRRLQADPALAVKDIRPVAAPPGRPEAPSHPSGPLAVANLSFAVDLASYQSGGGNGGGEDSGAAAAGGDGGGGAGAGGGDNGN